MWILAFSLIVIFASSSCKRNINKPKSLTYSLNMKIDYGDIDMPIDGSKLVTVSYLNSSSNDMLETSDEELSGVSLQIPEKTEVTIIIETDYNTYLNDISADASSEFDTTLKMYTFMMTNNKSFEVKLSKKTIEMMDFIFESGDNGVVEISVSENGVPKPKQIAKVGSNIKVSAVKENIGNYVISAEPKADNTYEFEKWSGSATGDDNPLTITSAMAGTITANFKKTVVSSDITFTFTAGENGSIYLFMLDGDDVVSNIIVAGNNSTGTLTLKESLFSKYTMQLAAYGLVGDTSYGIDKWGDGVASEKRSLQKTKTTYSATFSKTTITYGAGSPPNLNEDGWYEITSKNHLLYIANNGGSWWTNKYKVMNDIDYGGNYHLPIGNPFKGVINGNNKKIKNARFGMVDGFTGLIKIGHSTSMTISNLVIDSSVIINSSASYVGSFAGIILIGEIHNSVNEANITAVNTDYTRIGGIVGSFNSGKIENTYNTGAIIISSSSDRVGGIAGTYTNDSVIKNVYTIGGGVQMYYKVGNGTFNISGVSELPPNLHTQFNTALSTDVWGTKNGRPVLKGIGEGVGIN